MKSSIITISAIAGIILVAILVGRSGIVRNALAGADAGRVRDNNHYQKMQLKPVLLEKPVKIEHSFNFTNDTGHEVRLEKPVAGCGCAKVSINRMRLQPGESANCAVVLKLVSGYDGLKSVSSEVIAESGERWRFDLPVPVVSRLVVPPRVVLRSCDGSMDLSPEFVVQVRRAVGTNPAESFPVEFRTSHSEHLIQNCELNQLRRYNLLLIKTHSLTSDS